MERDEKQSFREAFLDVLAIVKACLTCFWFWVPVLFAIFMYMQLYAMTINPLLLVVVPIIIIAYALLWEEKRLKAQYGLKKVKVVKSLDPLFSLPRKEKVSEVEKLVEEYKRMLKGKKKKKSVKEKEDFG